MGERRVLISGAGVAGSAAAHWLSRHGWRATVVERAPALRSSGHTVDLRGPARTAVERMGVLDEVRAVRVEERGIAWVDDRGRRTAQLPADAFGGQGIVTDLEVPRGDLVRVLHAAAQGAEHRFGTWITTLAQDARGVDVELSDGTSGRYDLVVGADGVRSAVRALAFPGADHLHRLGCLLAYADVPDRYDLDGWMLMHSEPGTALALRPGGRAGRVQALLGVAVPRRGPGSPAAEQQRILRRAFAGGGWVTEQVLADLRFDGGTHLDDAAQVRMPSWSTGRVVLLGDAATCPSPLTGLGTSLAVVGALVLSAALAARPGDCRAALGEYEARMRPFAAQAQVLPPGGVRGFVPGTRAQIALGALSVRWMTRWPLRSLAARQFSKGADVDLPELLPAGAQVA